MSIEEHGRNALAGLIGFLFPAKKSTPEAVREAWQQGSIRKVLIVRTNQGIGDLLIATPVIRALHELEPRAELHFLAETYNAPAVLTNPRLKKVWIWDKKGMKSPWRLGAFLRDLRREKFDLVVMLTSNMPSFTALLLAKAVGARILWSYSTLPFYGGATWSRHLSNVEIMPPPDGVPERRKFMDVIRPLGVGPEGPTEFVIPEAARQKAAAAWTRMSPPADRKKVALFLGGNPDRPDRLWPADKWLSLAQALEQEPALWWVAVVPPEDLLSGTRAPEKGILADLRPHLKREPPWFADRDLAVVAGFLKGVDLFVCPDGGVLHIAIAAGVPTLGICTITDPVRWLPPVPWSHPIRSPTPDPSSLEWRAVWDRIRTILQIDLAARI